MIALSDVVATPTPGHRARAAGELIEQCRSDTESARLIQRAAINELLLHGASDAEAARLCGVPVFLVEHVRLGVGR